MLNASNRDRNVVYVRPLLQEAIKKVARLPPADQDAVAAAMIEELAARGFLEPEAERIKSELDVRLAAAESGGVEEARKTAEADPQNLMLQIRLADAYAAASQHRKALEICLDVVKQDFGDARNEAKSTMVKIFDMLGPASELTGEYRRKLATALY